jgi:glycosyltransferase involved in cell wall biosynthesis
MNCKSILFISKGKHAASTRYRALAYFDALRATTWRPMHITVPNNHLLRIELLREASRADVVVILRKTFSLPFFRVLRLCSKYLILDLDDAIFCRSNGKPSRTRNNRFAYIARHCQQIWAGNAYLADTARRYNAAVITLPTSLMPQKYTTKTEKSVDHIDLVWIGSSSSRRYLETALPTLERLVDDFPSLRLKIIADFDLPSQRLQTVAIRWSEEGQSSALSSSHIGIAPMPGNLWTRGKCGLKVLQYMAAGLPVVSSPAGVNSEIVEHAVTGFLAEQPEEWLTAIAKLVHNPDLRQAMGDSGRRRVVERYSVDITSKKMIRALEKIGL